MTKVLFIGDGYPVGTNAGVILYQRIMRLYGINHFCYYGVGYKTKQNWPEEFASVPRKLSSLRIWPRNRLTKYLKKIPLLEELYYYFFARIVEKKINIFIQENKVEIIVAVLRADVLAIINKINNKYPVLGYISDTVEAEFSDKPRIYRYKLKEYVKAIERADGIYVAGEAMKNYITTIYNKRTSILRLGYESNINSRKTINLECKEIRIFFSGSLYARTEFEIFLKALAVFNVKHTDYNISLTTATSYKIKTQIEGLRITNLGWLNEHDLVEVMQDSHIGYVPYKFDKSHENQMTYAFPSKAGFYISTGLPLFFHGPEYSSISKFYEIYPCGIHCASMNLNEIIVSLEKLIFDKEYYRKCCLESINAYKNEFSLSVLAKNFDSLICKSLL